MALVASAFKSILIGQMASNGMTGSYDPQLADAISQGVTVYILSVPICIQTVDSGQLGAGTGSSKVFGINQGILFPLMQGQFASEGLLGTFGTGGPLPNAISSAFSIWFNANNQTQTFHSGVGNGVGVGQVVNLDPSLMSSSIMSFMPGDGILGQYAPNVARAVGQSIVPHMLSAGRVVTPISGGGTVPGGGSGQGKII